MPYDWKALAPTRPLGIADIDAGLLYVPRAGEGAREIDALLSAGLEQPIALFGPAGAGKSTELAALAKLRQATWVGALVRLDKLLTYSDATSVNDVLGAIAKFTIRLAIHSLGLKLSRELEAAIGNQGADIAANTVTPGRDLLLATLREIRSVSRQGAVGLLVDGLEKAPSGLARETLVNIEGLRNDGHIVVVVPTELATGPFAAVLHDYHMMSIGPVIVDPDIDPSWESGFSFLLQIALRRVNANGQTIGDAMAAATSRCVDASGGLIRTFLQLLQKAALYAAMRGRDVPDEEDVGRAAQDQTSFLLRLLKEGDVEALRGAHNTSGIEIEISRRVRFLANGLLLEYRTSRGLVVHVAPLLQDAILKGG